MEEKIKDIFTPEEWSLVSEFEKETTDAAQDLPIELTVDQERMEDSIDG